MVLEKQMAAEHVPEFKCFVHASSKQSECITARMENNIKHTRCLYNILCTVNTQHTTRQDPIITIRLYLATCFGRDRPSSGPPRTTLRYSKNQYSMGSHFVHINLHKKCKFLFMIETAEYGKM